MSDTRIKVEAEGNDEFDILYLQGYGEFATVEAYGPNEWCVTEALGVTLGQTQKFYSRSSAILKAMQILWDSFTTQQDGKTYALRVRAGNAAVLCDDDYIGRIYYRNGYYRIYQFGEADSLLGFASMSHAMRSIVEANKDMV